MININPLHSYSIQQLKEYSNTVFVKVDEGIYQIEKDRKDNFSGRGYVSTQEVIDELNSTLKVTILKRSIMGALELLHSNL